MANGQELGQSVFRSPPATATSQIASPTRFGQRLTRPPAPAPVATPQEEAEAAVQALARDLDELQHMIRGQVNEAQISGKDVQRIFGPQSGIRKLIDRQIETFRDALTQAGRDPLIADRSRDLILGQIPPPQAQITTTKPGEDIQVITAGPGGARTAERIGGTAPLPTVVPQGGTLAETLTGRVLTRGRPTTRKADTQVVAARDKDGNIVNVVVSKVTGKVVGEFGRGPETSFVVPRVPGVGREELAKLDEAEIGATQAIQGAFKLRQAVLEGGPQVLAAPGVLSGLAQGAVSQFLGFAQLAGVDVGNFESGASAEEAEAKADTIFARIDTAGTINAEIRSSIVNLAFAAAAASGQTGRGVSDRDYERFVRELGAGASKPAVFASVLTKFAQRLNDNFTTRFRVKMRRIPGRGKETPPDLFKEIFGASGASTAAASGTAGEGARAASLPEGTTATNPSTGESLVVRGGKWVSQ